MAHFFLKKHYTFKPAMARLFVARESQSHLPPSTHCRARRFKDIEISTKKSFPIFLKN